MIKDSLKKGFHITSEGAFPIFIWVIFNMTAGFYTKFLFADQIKNNENFFLSPISIFTWGASLIIYIYLHAATLTYVRNKILLISQSKTDFFFKGLKYLFPIALFNLIFFFFLIILALILCFIFFSSPAVGLFSEAHVYRPFQMIFYIGFAIFAAFTGILYCLCLFYSSTVIVAADSKVSAAIEKSIKFMRCHFWTTIRLGILSVFPFIILQSLGLFEDYFAGNKYIQGVELVLSALTVSFFEIYVCSVIMDFYLKHSVQESNRIHVTQK